MRNTLIAALALGLAFTFAPATQAYDDDLPGPINSLGDLQDTAKMLFKLADSNNDGLISQQEAIDAGNLLVGGFFFRADLDGDGKVTKEEADQARENLFAQRPLLRFVFERGQQEAQAQGEPHPADLIRQNVLQALDTNGDGAIDAAELRQGVQTTVQSLFLAADRNGDGHLDPNELNIAVVEAGQAGIRAAFQAADADNSGGISRDEFHKAIIQPANVVFRIFDANNDGEITQEELNNGIRLIANELRSLEVQEPAKTLPDRIDEAVQATGAAQAPNTAGAQQSQSAAPAPAPVQQPVQQQQQQQPVQQPQQ